MEPIKYTKSPPVRNQLYVEEEFRKIEQSLQTLMGFVLENFGMATIEAGTWIPTIQGSTVAGVATYTLQWGNYYKIGRFVCAHFRVTTSAHTGTGAPKILGLPAKVFGNGGFQSNFTGALYSGITAGNLLITNINAGVSVIDIYTGNPHVSAAMGAAMDFIGVVNYMTD